MPAVMKKLELGFFGLKLLTVLNLQKIAATKSNFRSIRDDWNEVKNDQLKMGPAVLVILEVRSIKLKLTQVQLKSVCCARMRPLFN